MPKRTFLLSLTDDDVLYVEFDTRRGKVLQFVVKYSAQIDKKWWEIVRYDSGHNCPHQDILHPTKGIVRKVWYEFLDNSAVLTLAIREIKAQYPFLRERFTRWLTKE